MSSREERALRRAIERDGFESAEETERVARWAAAEIDRLRAERQAVLHCVNLYGDEVLHVALDGIEWMPRKRVATDGG